MEHDELGGRVSAVAALAEPVRRALYLYVVGRPEPVSRDQACEGLGIARHTAKFHLDRLVEEGLLTTSFKRLGERRGPGAGRPAKLYRRADGELAVTLPERRYDLAGELMAQAIEESTRSGVPVLDALRAAARERGRSLGRRFRSAPAPDGPAHDGPAPDGPAPDGPDPDGGPSSVLDTACEALMEHGYAPRREGERVELRNCPFHLLAAQHTSLVCGMNLALLEGVAAELDDDSLSVRLQPRSGWCCVVLQAA